MISRWPSHMRERHAGKSRSTAGVSSRLPVRSPAPATYGGKLMFRLQVVTHDRCPSIGNRRAADIVSDEPGVVIAVRAIDCRRVESAGYRVKNVTDNAKVCTLSGHT